MLTSSPLLKASNNIIKLSRKVESTSLRTKSKYSRFLDFLTSKTNRALGRQLPSSIQIRKLMSFNILNSFGSVGGLLSGLGSRSMDIGQLITSFFPGKNSKVGSFFKNDRASIRPRLVGNKLRLGGVRALGVVNALFAGVDFISGVKGGEPVGKAASGAAGSLAGSFLGGVIGQSLIPIPGVGFIVGSSIGSFLGGWGADRAYDFAVNAKSKQEEKLKEKPKFTSVSGVLSDETIEKLNSLVEKFDIPVNKFQSFVNDVISGKINFGGAPVGYADTTENDNPPPGTPSGDLQDVEAIGGESPGTPDSPYGWRGERMHQGNDYFKNVGTPISVIQPGVVSVADMNYDSTGWGAVVEIRHENGSISRYAHLSKIYVKKGEVIEPGRVIGLTGGAVGAPGSGNSKGPHLHFEYETSEGKRIDPTKYAPKIFKFGGNVRVKPKEQPQQTGIQTSITTTSSITPSTLQAIPDIKISQAIPELKYELPYNKEENDLIAILPPPQLTFVGEDGGNKPTFVPISSEQDSFAIAPINKRTVDVLAAQIVQSGKLQIS